MIGIAKNSFWDGANWRSRIADIGNLIQIEVDGSVRFYSAPSVAAGAIQALTTKQQTTSAGVLTVLGNTVRHNGNIFHGRVNSDGTPARLPPGWSSVKTGTGQYRITHSLGVAYSVVAYLSDNGGEISSSAISLNDFLVNTAYDGTGNIDRAFNFILMLD